MWLYFWLNYSSDKTIICLLFVHQLFDPAVTRNLRNRNYLFKLGCCVTLSSSRLPRFYFGVEFWKYAGIVLEKNLIISSVYMYMTAVFDIDHDAYLCGPLLDLGAPHVSSRRSKLVTFWYFFWKTPLYCLPLILTNWSVRRLN